VGRVFAQALQANGREIARQSRLELTRRDRVGRANLLERLERRCGQKGRPARQHFVEDRAQGVDISRGPDFSRFSLAMLGRHVAGRADDHAARGLARSTVLVRLLGQAEVADLGDAVDGEKYVRWFQVAMDDPLAVGVLDGQGERRDHPGGHRGRRRLMHQPPVQAFATHIFLDDERSALVAPGAENLDDIGVLEPGQGRRFDQQPGSLRRGAGELRPEKLEGDPAAEIELLGQVDHAHAAPAAFSQNHEPRDLR
jgi:hypothetical protein